MNHNERLQKLKRLQNLLQELNVLESRVLFANPEEESSVCLTSQNTVQHSQSSFAKKEIFANACKKSLSLFYPQIHIGDNQQLCAMIDCITVSHNKQSFWTNVQSWIPQKSVTQVKEYYQKCFSRVKYEYKICEEDKNMLKQLSVLMKDSKPADVVNCFMERYKEKSYFKRTLVMYIVYLRK
ncbi:Hypothetical_protein [Hexamita inflata]|uniref:Hypothetical_protein n=1 Tax=Hexamita inflata TaxID=28002 RepID=A0AA86UCX2_9EUKA|nr:Hypothetical protein HINF_LOCUS38339 [Hexamita inflata]